MALNTVTIDDLQFPEGRLPEIFIYDWGTDGDVYRVKVLTKHGIDKQDFAVSSDRSLRERSFRLSNIPLMISVAPVSAGIRRGHIYVQVHLRLGGILHWTLIAGYVYQGKRLTWPPGHFEDSISGQGRLRSILGTDPAAGAEVNETVPTNARWRFWGFKVRLVTDATVANRVVRLVIDDGSVIVQAAKSHENHSASLTRDYVGPVSSIYSTGDTYIMLVGLSPPIFLFQGWRIRTDTVLLAAGDNYGAPQLFVEEWIEE